MKERTSFNGCGRLSLEIKCYSMSLRLNIENVENEEKLKESQFTLLGGEENTPGRVTFPKFDFINFVLIV